MGLKSVERRLKTLRRLFARSAKILLSMLKNADAYFPFFHFYYIFTLARAARKFFYGSIAFDAKKWPMLKNSATLIQFRPRREVADAYLRRRQLPTDEYSVRNKNKMEAVDLARRCFQRVFDR